MTPKCLECGTWMHDKPDTDDWIHQCPECKWEISDLSMDDVLVLAMRYPDLVQRIKERWLGETNDTQVP